MSLISYPNLSHWLWCMYCATYSLECSNTLLRIHKLQMFGYLYKISFFFSSVQTVSNENFSLKTMAIELSKKLCMCSAQCHRQKVLYVCPLLSVNKLCSDSQQKFALLSYRLNTMFGMNNNN